MATPRQQTDHTLDCVKGGLPSNMGLLDNFAPLSANVTIDPVYAGRVVHRNDDEEYEMGCTGTQMAIFLNQNSDDSDIDVGGGDVWTDVIPGRGNMSGVVATAGLEIATTEYDTAQDYHMNDPLRAVASNSNATTGGRLTNAGVTLGTNAICGIVSKLPALNSHRVSVLTLWPVFCPGTA